MSVTDNLGTRMKEFYETIPKTRLMRRTPVAIRIDGKAFHTFTKNFAKPFDEVLSNTMIYTMEYLCENIQGCVFGYTQSDEITLLLIDYQTFETQAWFDYEVQKICSIAASMATLAFNKFFKDSLFEWTTKLDTTLYYENRHRLTNLEYSLNAAYEYAIEKGAMFDARCFNIPREEACNLVYWRQIDAIRNSIQMVGQSQFSHSALQGKSCSNIQDMLIEQCSIDWNDYPTRWKRGAAWRKDIGIDYEMPILKGKNRAYVNDAILYKEEQE